MLNFLLGFFIAISIFEFLLIFILFKFIKKLNHNDFLDTINDSFDKFLRGVSDD